MRPGGCDAFGRLEGLSDYMNRGRPRLEWCLSVCCPDFTCACGRLDADGVDMDECSSVDHIVVRRILTMLIPRT